MKIHRPYFDSSEFHKLPDAIALQRYNEASSRVRSLLQSKGYSQEFLAALFRIPREQAKQLTYQEIAGLPIDVALDELLSARCYSGNEETLRNYAAVEVEISRLEKASEKLAGELPQRPGYELERDALFAQDYARLNQMWRRITELRGNAAQLQNVYKDFNGCKRRERIQASLRKSGQPLTPENRSKIRQLAIVVGSPENNAARELIAKKMPDHEFGRKASEELKEREERLRTLWQELQRTLPAAHIDFIAEAIK